MKYKGLLQLHLILFVLVFFSCLIKVFSVPVDEANHKKYVEATVAGKGSVDASMKSITDEEFGVSEKEELRFFRGELEGIVTIEGYNLTGEKAFEFELSKDEHAKKQKIDSSEFGGILILRAIDENGQVESRKIKLP